MIDGKTFSVLVTNYARFANLDKVLKSWLSNPIDELILLDCSGKAIHIKEVSELLADKRLKIISFTNDFGTRTDYSVAMISGGDMIIAADDDLTVDKDFTETLYGKWKQLGGFVGIHGRVSENGEYKSAKGKTGYLTKTDVSVTFVGVIYMAERKYFCFDTRGMSRNVDDIWHCMKEHPEVDKWVVPIRKYHHLPEAKCSEAMCRMPNLAKERIVFFKTWWKHPPRTPKQEVKK